MHFRARINMKIAILTIGLILVMGFGHFSQAFAQSPQDPIPNLAYYYIWYTEASWDRAKSDYPQLGRYSSDDRSVMEQHVKWAKEASIKGFIVSWKSTPILNRRLEMLIDVAAKANFSLWIIYQGLDFDRKPLPVSQIDHDFQYFVENYADNPVFKMYDKPVVIWSGTWEFTPSEVSQVTSGYRNQLYILASERSVDGYISLANAVDGDAYYWSSVDPVGQTGYQKKLDDMSAAVHDNHGLWIAPAAPGYDARLLDGKRLIERDNGKTFRLELTVALRSSPDAIGIISWNEFSENSHIEPSVNYGTTALDVLSNGHASAPTLSDTFDFDSSAIGTSKGPSGDVYNLTVIGAVIIFIAITIILAIIRHRGSSNITPNRPT
ncbi:MAG: endo-1,3-alpha-glucanase family glycosylhydrolase [Chloroflexota bacterium]